jgi:hypothetical protein
MAENRFISPGTRVCRLDYSGEASVSEPEYGVVIHCWHDAEICGYDCYVAFFGEAFPEGKLAEKPYVLRYAAVSLTTLAD